MLRFISLGLSYLIFNIVGKRILHNIPNKRKPNKVRLILVKVGNQMIKVCIIIVKKIFNNYPD